MDDQANFDGKIAIVGISLRAPGVSNPQELWASLLAGTVSSPSVGSGKSGSTFFARQIAGIGEFDHKLFKMQPSLALISDPQLRLFLTLAWEALEDAGVDPQRFGGRIGVFAGCGRDDYRRYLLDKEPSYSAIHGRQQIDVMNDRDYFAANLSYQLNLTGPSLTIQTACSTSLVAVHVATHSLLTGESDLAIAGGLTVQIPDLGGYQYQEGSIYSADGRCRPFTEESTGTVPSSGGGLVILARAGDVDARFLRPYACIIGTAVNNDGARKMNFAAPTADGHEAAIREALDFAGVEADQIDFVQAHGTGTRLGDEIELSAMRRTYGAAASNDHPCALGSIKANLGHTDTGAGVLGLITCALAVKEGTIPPTPSQVGDGNDIVHRDGPSRLFIPRRPVSWPSQKRRRAAVSSLGLGGTNAHAIVEEAPESHPGRAQEPGPSVFTLSGTNAKALGNAARQLAAFMECNRDAPIQGIASTLWHGRQHLAHRWAATIASREDGIKCLSDLAGKADEAVPVAGTSKLAILLQGQGERIGHSFAGLARISPSFRREFGILRDAILDAGGEDVLRYETMSDDNPLLERTDFVQPLLFALQVALLRSLGIAKARPILLVGHSLGEFVSAIFGGLMNDGDAAAAIVMRGRLMAAAPEGAMVAVRVPDSEAIALCEEFDLEVTTTLSESTLILGGDRGAVQRLVDSAAARHFVAILLPARKAFHSRAMEVASHEFTRFLKGIRLNAPIFDIASNSTGDRLSPDLAVSPAYWGNQIRAPVNMKRAIDTLLTASPTGILDIGPGRGMSNLVRERARSTSSNPATFCFAPGRPRPANDPDLGAFAAMWCAGFDIELPVPQCKAERLPTYPFDSAVFWPSASAEVASLTLARSATSTNGDMSNNATTIAKKLEADTGAPNSGVYKSIHRIWSDAFGHSGLSERDDFFEVGGTSLHAAQILRRVNTECGVRVRLHDLYDYPILSDFSAYVASQLGGHVPQASRSDEGATIRRPESRSNHA